MLFVVEQSINGLQLGVTLFLVAAGLTLVFGVMNVANMAHGSFYMVGAYVFRSAVSCSGSYVLAMLVATTVTCLIGLALELAIMRRLYGRSLLDQVIVTFGVILVVNGIVAVIWGVSSPPLRLPEWISGSVNLGGLVYPTVRLSIILIGLACALLLYILVSRTRTGMLIRAGATNRAFLPALGVNISLLYSAMFAMGAALAGIAGAATSPITAVRIGMGETILVPVLVVLVIGGMGSVRGAFLAALVIGIADTFGRVYLPNLFSLGFAPDVAASAGASVSAELIFMIMLSVLLTRRV